MQEKLDAWLKQFEADNGRKPTAQEFQDAKKKIALEIEMDRLHDNTNSTGDTSKEVPSTNQKTNWVLIVGAIVLVAVIVLALNFA